MQIIESIKEFLRRLDAKINPPIDYSKMQIHLRRGTMEQIRTGKVFHNGEIVVCLDEPYLAIGTPTGFDFVPIDSYSDAADALRDHYPDIRWR